MDFPFGGFGGEDIFFGFESPDKYAIYSVPIPIPNTIEREKTSNISKSILSEASMYWSNFVIHSVVTLVSIDANVIVVIKTPLLTIVVTPCN